MVGSDTLSEDQIKQIRHQQEVQYKEVKSRGLMVV